ncbi:rhomboid family intramembrane serine protease [Alteromonas sp. 5E99-2]|uniref:rhomboid family intramembrane serine protease n=1 Tax=Alteromonas sp. 5E99-2 TaxID=2817683 RepID=UPI001A996DF6|nr:rhomboid family intramembrane serine protease [Alteromonas sp. 5E99-2]MBO1256634.1 rhomboid family intramembrane serine protease [Alteromonas sp. 5E99-2]
MNRVEWLSHTNLPLKEGDCWGKLNKNEIKLSSLEEQRERIRRWQPQQRLLINLNRFHRMVPPIYCSKYRKIIKNNLKYRYKVISVTSIIPVYLFLLLHFFFNYKFDYEAVGSALGFIGLCLAYFLTYKLGLSNTKLIKERSLFYYWLFNSVVPRKALLFCVLYGGGIAFLQLFFQQFLGTTDAVFELYGIMYEEVSNQDYWRFFTGPNLHYSLLHFFVNYLTLLMVGTLSISLTGYKSTFIFIIGNAVGAYCQFVFGGSVFDNYGGISSGNFALFSWLLGYNCFYKNNLPQGFSYTIGIVGIIGLISGELLNSNSATVAHVTGILFGLAASFFYSCYAYCIQRH